MQEEEGRKAESKPEKGGKSFVRRWSRNVPIRHNPDPTSLAAIRRAQPNIILARPPDFDREMRSKTIMVSCLGVEPFSEFLQALTGVFSGDGPF